MSFWFTACQNDVARIDDITKYYLSEGGVVAPDAVIWSGSQTFTNSFKDNKSVSSNSRAFSDESRASNENNRKNEVEAHLYVQNNSLMNGSTKYEISDITSILSLYVRYPNDVEIILPVPEEIFLDKNTVSGEGSQTNSAYQGEKVSYFNLIGENTVALHIEYVSARQDDLTSPVKLEGYGEFNGGYIHIFTAGIDENVLNYCRDYYDDGLNFKVYNFYHRGNQNASNNGANIDKTGLKKHFLDRALINFDWQTTDIASKNYPDQYVNAISSDELSNPLDSDCHVWILGDSKVKESDNGLFSRSSQQLKNGTAVLWNSNDTISEDMERNHFNDPYQGQHFNNSPFNLIYLRKGLEK